MSYILRLYSGRLSRWHYFLGRLIGLTIFAPPLLLVWISQNNQAIKYLLPLIYLASLVYFFSLDVKRLHDLNKSGWWSLLLIIPLIGLFFQLYLLFKPGNIGKNKYGNPSNNNLLLNILAL